MIPYWFVKATNDKSLANMEASTAKLGDGWTMPCWKNKEKVEAGQQLLYWKARKDEESQGSVAKKQKTS